MTRFAGRAGVDRAARGLPRDCVLWARRALLRGREEFGADRLDDQEPEQDPDPIADHLEELASALGTRSLGLRRDA